MAIVGNIDCQRCHQIKREAYSPPTPDYCSQCRADLEQEAKDAFLNKVRSMPLEERTIYLAEILYEIQKRLPEMPTGPLVFNKLA